MNTLLIADHNNKKLADVTFKAISAATQLKGELHVLIAGKGCQAVAKEASETKGVSKVLLAEDNQLERRLAEPMAAFIKGLADRYEYIVGAATTDNKNILPRLAGLLDVMQISDVIEILPGPVFLRPIYAGNAIQKVQSKDKIKLMTIRTAAFAAAEKGGSAPIESLAGSNPANSFSTFIEEAVKKNERPELTSARIIISGGRALGSAEKFREVILPLADKLGAAVGASRAAVDAGYAPNDWQVGQTGKVVAPDLYIACGISGAIQHLAGMKDSKVIVAINKDPDAPIFQIADYGLVADLFEVLPEFEKALAKS